MAALLLLTTTFALADNQKPELYNNRRRDFGVLMAPAGSAARPSMSFEFDNSGENEGFFLNKVTPAVCAAINGVSVACFDASGLTLSGFTPGSVLFIDALGGLEQDNPNFFFDDTGKQLEMGFGTAALPAYTFKTDDNTGIFRSAVDEISVVTAGVSRVILGSADTRFTTSVLPSVTNTSDLGSTSLRWRDIFVTGTAGSVVFINALGALDEDPTSFFYDDLNNQIETLAGTSTSPPYTFANDDNTGLFRSTIDEVSITTGGLARVFFGNTNTRFVTSVFPSADAVVDLGSTSLRWRDVFASSSVQIGTSPAASGALRVANNAALVSRNAANSADLNIARIDSANTAVFGDSGTAVSIGPSGTAFRNILHGSFTIDLGSIPAQVCTDLDIFISGAAVNDICFVSPSATPNDPFSWSCWIQIADNARMRLCNVSAAASDPPSLTYRAVVLRR